MTRRRIVSTEEQDIHTGWRRYLCYLRQKGVLRKAKRRTNKRERREGVQEIRKEAQE